MTRKPKILTDGEWVATACLKTDGSPVLQGVYACDGEIAATNRHILHVAKHVSGEYAIGIRNPKTGAFIEGDFPAYRQVIPDGYATHTVDVAELRGMAAAAVAYAKTVGLVSAAVPVDIHGVRVDGAYLLTILAGAYSTGKYATKSDATLVKLGDKLTPLRFDMLNRTAVLMPTRQDGPAKFDASHAVIAI